MKAPDFSYYEAKSLSDAIKFKSYEDNRSQLNKVIVYMKTVSKNEWNKLSIGAISQFKV